MRRRYGRDFGGHFLIELVEGVTQMRPQPPAERQKDQLADLAVLNERLSATGQPWTARKRLEYLKKQREQWEAITEHVTRSDAAATVAIIEEAARRVRCVAASMGFHSFDLCPACHDTAGC